MADVLSDRRFVTYLVLSNVVLVALAVVGPLWFVVGLVGFVAIECVSAFRDQQVRHELALAVRSRR